jgi:hypothetical protein
MNHTVYCGVKYGNLQIYEIHNSYKNCRKHFLLGIFKRKEYLQDVVLGEMKEVKLISVKNCVKILSGMGLLEILSEVELC